MWAHAVGFCLLLGWIPFDPARVVGSDLLVGAGAGGFGLAGLAFLYTGLARGRAAVVAPSAAVLGAVIPVAVGAAEGVGPTAWVGVASALPAIYLLSGGGGSSRRADGLGHGLAAGASFGGYFVVLSLASGESGMWPLVASRGFTTLLLAVAAVAVRSLWLSPPRGAIGWAVAGVGAMDLTGNVGFLLAVARAPLVVVAVVASLYPAVTVLASRLAHGEQITPAQAVGIGMAVAAVALFSVS